MREILFRGKEKGSREYVFGGIVQGVVHELWKNADRAYITVFPEFLSTVKLVEVDPATVGQYTGLKDKNSKRIFEGDIIKIPDDYDEFGLNAGEIYEVYFICGGFRLKPKYTKARGYWLEDDETVEVIGNIHDNPELLEVKDDD